LIDGWCQADADCDFRTNAESNKTVRELICALIEVYVCDRIVVTSDGDPLRPLFRLLFE
jgi:hypothetical protein